jgi:hypothetical protein
MNRHGVLLPVFVVFRVGGKRAFRQVEQRISIEKRAYIGLIGAQPKKLFEAPIIRSASDWSLWLLGAFFLDGVDSAL